ncbi:MAG: carboxypeptidase-like regulatory domain-containing protein [Candidatus Sericytochromatia bacterium]
MKNKFILSFLLIPVFVACQNTVNVSSSSSPQPSKSSVSNNNISSSPTNSVIVSASPSVSISPIVTPQVTPSDIQESATPIIESNMIDESLVYTGLNVSLPPVPDEYMKNLGEIKGIVYDRNNKPVKNVNVTAIGFKSNKSTNSYFYNTKTNQLGEYTLIVPNNSELLNENLRYLVIEAGNENSTKRYVSISLYLQFYGTNEYPTIYYFDEFNSINKEPEIQRIVVNYNNINGYLLTKSLNSKISKEYGRKININIDLPKFKLQSTDNLRLEFDFNNSIIKDSIEKNLIIESLDKTIDYDYNTKNSTFTWLDDNKRVIFECPIQKYDKDMKYKIYFKEPFIDSNNNKAYQGEYISLKSFQFNELSENIIFEIAGNK